MITYSDNKIKEYNKKVLDQFLIKTKRAIDIFGSAKVKQKLLQQADTFIFKI